MGEGKGIRAVLIVVCMIWLCSESLGAAATPIRYREVREEAGWEAASQKLQPGEAFDPPEQEELGLHSQSAVLMDAKSGRVLWEKNGDQIRPMASTTKVMTCILALEAGLGQEGRDTKVSQYAASQPQVRLGMRTGQRFFTRDLLYSLMLESHNDSAVAVAEATAGSVPAFAAQMNQKARELGCMDTWFITPNGLDGKEKDKEGVEHIHSTTAKDLARILNYCILESPKSQEFLSITRTMDYHFQDAEGKGNYQCRNHNNLFSMMDGVISGKTGFTGGAGYCYTGAVEDEGRIFTIALLGCGWPPHKTDKWSDAKKLLAYGKEHYQYRNLYREVELEPVQVVNGVKPCGAGGQKEGRDSVSLEGAKGGEEGRGSVSLESAERGEEGRRSASLEGAEGRGESRDSATWKEGWQTDNVQVSLVMENQDKELKVLTGELDRVRIVKNLPKALEAPVAEGDPVGTVDYYLNGQPIASYPVLAGESAERFSFSWSMKQVKSMFFMQYDF